MPTSRKGEKSPDLGLAIRELGFLQRLAQAAASTRQPDELVELIIRETTSAMDTDVCSLYLLDHAGARLNLRATNGLNERMIGRVTMRVGEGITGWVASSREALVVPDVTVDTHWKWIPGLDQENLRSMLSVPIEAGDRLVGVINVQTSDVREYSGADIEFLRAIAGQVAGLLERSELQRRAEQQLAEIRLSHDIHERFTRLTLEGAGVPAILEAVGSLAGGAAGLYSGDGFRLGPARHGEHLPARLQVPAGLAGGDPRETRIEAGRPPRPLDLVPVRAGEELLGVLAVGLPEGDGIDPDGRRRALEHGSTVLALELSKERAAAEVERRLRGDLVEELLSGGLDDEEAERVAQQAERLGHRLPHPAWVLVLEPDDTGADGTDGELGSRGRQDRLDAALTDLLRRRVPGAFMLARSSSVVMLAPEDAVPDLPAAERLAGQVQTAAAAVLRPGTASIGIGNLARTVSELARSHHEARQAIRLSRRAGGRAQVTSYRSLGAFRLLLEVQNRDALTRFVGEVLGPLLKYSESRETPLLETLEALVAARWVRRQAARALGIHINSMNYRVSRIEELAAVSLDDPEMRVAFAIALRARGMLGS
ncbi:MAG TPA: GAF domain-containing protein [Candidatus Dormibacteraeota bacterium]